MFVALFIEYIKGAILNEYCSHDGATAEFLSSQQLGFLRRKDLTNKYGFWNKLTRITLQRTTQQAYNNPLQ